MSWCFKYLRCLPHPKICSCIAAPWREDHALRVAAALEQLGVAAAPVAAAFA